MRLVSVVVAATATSSITAATSTTLVSNRSTRSLTPLASDVLFPSFKYFYDLARPSSRTTC